MLWEHPWVDTRSGIEYQLFFRLQFRLVVSKESTRQQPDYSFLHHSNIVDVLV